MAELNEIYEGVLRAAGGAENISALGNCMTRLRFTVRDGALVNASALKQIPGVLGYVCTHGQHQLILGPSMAAKTAEYFRSRRPFAPLGGAETNAAPSVGEAKETKQAVKRKYSSRLSGICASIGNIFLPLIPAYIGCGLILGINNLLSSTVLAQGSNTSALLAVFGGSIFFYLNAVVGYNANKEFGGTPALGAAFAGILNFPALGAVTLFGAPLSPGKGGIIAVLLVCYAGSQVEKFLRARIKGSLEMFLTPTLTILTVGVAALAFIQPAAGFLSDKLSVYTQAALQHGGALVGAVLGGLFLPLVMLGVHQSLVPLHQQLLDALGNNPLFPILCMAGAGQVGAGLAVLFKTKNARLKTIVKNALPVGILGIGEPLIYGVTLPLFKPFVAACIGAAAGGAVVAALHVTSAIAFGVSGVVLLVALSNLHSVIFYCAGYLAAVAVGFAVAWRMGFDDPKL